MSARPVRVDSDGRECVVCRTYRPWDQYPPDPTARGGASATCADCAVPRSAPSGGRTPEIGKDGRTCLLCGHFKPWDQFGRRTRGINGRQPLCVPCYNRRARVRHNGKKESAELADALVVNDEGRQCTVCRVFKPWRHYRFLQGAVGNRREACQTCENKRRSADSPPPSPRPYNSTAFHDANGRECASCGHYKPWEQFAKQARGRNGHRSTCRSCNNISAARYRAEKAAQPGANRRT